MRVLLTIDRDNDLWAEARRDARSAFLPFALREIVEGRVEEVVVPLGEWGKLQSFLASLPGGATRLPLAVADAPPPAAPETSERALVARKLSEIVVELGAGSPFGGDVLREEGGRYYGVPFARGRELMGMVFVYSVGYVRVAFTAGTAHPPPEGLPAQDSRVFATVEDAARFLVLCLQHKFADALAVPQRARRTKKGPKS